MNDEFYRPSPIKRRRSTRHEVEVRRADLLEIVDNAPTFSGNLVEVDFDVL